MPRLGVVCLKCHVSLQVVQQGVTLYFYLKCQTYYSLLFCKMANNRHTNIALLTLYEYLLFGKHI